MTIAEKLTEIRERLACALARAGRPADSARLLAVSKTFPADAVVEAVVAGQVQFGENKVQEALGKISHLPSTIEWHLIGPLQRNKVRKALPLFSLIHAVDSLRLAQAISQIAGELGMTARILLEVNVDGEASKFGFNPQTLHAEILSLTQLPHIEIRGLMCIPQPQACAEDMRPAFIRVRELALSLEEQAKIQLPELSMGMSDDFEVAIEEGSTIIRVGSAIFGHR